jgi:hypothetical protein
MTANPFFFRRALATVQAHLGTAAAPAAPAESAANGESMDVDAVALPEEVDAKITATGEE